MKQLKFSHITKTGGTSIENIAKNNNIYWGRFDLSFNKRWHIPLSKLNYILKNRYDWFIICRNPYDRIISEYHCKWGGIGKNKKLLIKKHNKIQFNNYVRNRIKNRKKFKYLGHYLPQHLYHIPNVNVLKFENLKDDFDILMKKYNLKLELNVKDNSNQKFFTIHDFDKQTINLINKVYHKDFKIFNYEKIKID